MVRCLGTRGEAPECVVRCECYHSLVTLEWGIRVCKGDTLLVWVSKFQTRKLGDAVILMLT